MNFAKRSRPISIKNLRDALLDLLRDGPATSDDLARLTRYSSNAVRERLIELQIYGYAVRTSVPRVDGTGRRYVWSINKAVGQIPLPNPERQDGRNIGQPRQTITQTYPAFSFRDPMVAALFGPHVDAEKAADIGAQQEGC